MTTQELTKATRRLQVIDLSDVADNPWQPRAAMDQAELQELADSIREHGLWQQPTVRPAGDGYELAFGHRRLAAMRLLGWDAAELEVRELTDRQMAVIALGENTKRKDLSTIEQYRAWQKALQIEGMTVQDLATSVGLDRSTVSNNLRLLSLPGWILKYVESGELSAHGAREFLCLQGGDGHFHEDEAKEVIAKIEGGVVPDWRVNNVRKALNEVVTGSSVKSWRRLFKGRGWAGNHTEEPLFMMGAFKQEAGARVHMVPNDEFRSEYVIGGGQKYKLMSTDSREWTCATGIWVNRQSKAKATGAKVTKNVAVPEGVSAAAFKTTLSADPVFAAVSQETEGTLMQALASDDVIESAMLERLGTRAAPVVLEMSADQFKAPISDRNRGNYYPDHYGVAMVPSYFPNSEECQKMCNFGATYGTFGQGSGLTLWCLNRQHFYEKVEQGEATIRAKAGRKVKALDDADAKALGRLSKIGVPSMTHLLAAVLLGGQRFEAVAPEGLDWREKGPLSVWPANTQRIFELLGTKPEQWAEKGLLGAVGLLTEEYASELLMRLLVEETHDEAIRQFVPDEEALNAAIAARANAHVQELRERAGASRKQPATEAEAAEQADGQAALAARSRA